VSDLLLDVQQNNPCFSAASVQKDESKAKTSTAPVSMSVCGAEVEA